jgi:hypothetical protein
MKGGEFHEEAYASYRSRAAVYVISIGSGGEHSVDPEESQPDF